MQKEYLDGVASLTAFVDESNRKFSAPVEVSFLDVKMFVQDLEVSLHSILFFSFYKRKVCNYLIPRIKHKNILVCVSIITLLH